MTINTEITLDRVTEAVQAILHVLGEPQTNIQQQALIAFQSGDYQTVKRLASTNLADFYIKSLGYLGGALKLTPNTDTVLAESARAAAGYAQEKALQQLSHAIAKALN